jgi:hypothetical protein
MQNELLNQDVTESDLQKCIISLLESEVYLKDECKEIMQFEAAQNRLSKLSHYIFSIANRAISLSRGFVTLVNQKNYLCAISLLRLQADTLMRLYAMTNVDSVPKVFKAILQGEELRNLKDSNGKAMSDTYLAKEVDKIFPGFNNLYKNTCGFIHFSDKHLFANTNFSGMEENLIPVKITIGDIEDNYSLAEKVDYTFNMFIVTKNIYKVIKSYRISLQKTI